MKIQIIIIKSVLTACILMYMAVPVAAQNIVQGYVYEKAGDKQLPLPGATVIVTGTTSGSLTNVDGHFTFTATQPYPFSITASYVGYTSDTILISDASPVTIQLLKSVSLAGVNILGRQESTVISTLKTINTEQVGKKELLKAACCNLSESFETNPSVNVSYTDAITGAKEIQMLGLSGIYSQVMTENIPFVRGLGATYGLGYVPGPWMESIQITKGSGSVANGYESTSGQINVEYIKPENSEKFYFNGYGASSGNTELNSHASVKVNDNFTGLLFVHGENNQTKWDHQDDGFLDMPLVSQGHIFNRWSYNDGKRFEGQFGIRALMENRRSGQTFYDWENEADTSTGYGVRIATKRYEAFSKTGLVFPEKPWKSAGLILSGSLHDQDSYFGLKTYSGNQNSFYGSFIFMSIINTTNHKWKAGIDLRYDKFDESFLLQDYKRTETVPGVYVEYTLNVREKLGIVAGSRMDHHNEWGFFYTPRLHMKYNFSEQVILRLSGGRSFRTANVFADNTGNIMATSRNLIIEEELRPERAWNFGSNFTAKFRMWYRPGSVSLDYYVTDFTNQVIVDVYSSENYIEIYNLKGNSYANSFQAALNYEVAKRFDVRLAYKNDRVVTDYNGISSRKPLIPEHRALLNMAYETINEHWKFDFTTHFQGKSKLALAGYDEISGHGDTQIRNGMSPEFFTFNAQVTYLIKNWELYLGGENLSGFRQENPVMHASHPFEEGFDATNVWGPVMGRKIYLGFRYSLKSNLKNNK
jgi:outer membrane receptor for ferrienterochelin and colicins